MYPLCILLGFVVRLIRAQIVDLVTQSNSLLDCVIYKKNPDDRASYNLNSTRRLSLKQT